MASSKTVAAVFLAGIVLLSFSIVCTARLAVGPLSLILDIPAEDRGGGSISIVNTGDDPIELKVSLHDWWRGPDGALQILPPGTVERSCSAWVRFAPSSLVMSPGEKTDLSVEIAVPADVEGDHWSLLLVEEVPPPQEREKAEGLASTTRVIVSYAIKILQKDSTTENQSLEIRGVELVEQDPLTFGVHIANTGNAHLTATGALTVQDTFGETVREFDIKAVPALPGEERTLVVTDETGFTLEPGQYFVIAIVDFGGEYLVQGGLPFAITPAAAEEENET